MLNLTFVTGASADTAGHRALSSRDASFKLDGIIP